MHRLLFDERICRGIIFRHTVTIGIHNTQIESRGGKTLLSSFRIPLYCRGIIFTSGLQSGYTYGKEVWGDRRRQAH